MLSRSVPTQRASWISTPAAARARISAAIAGGERAAALPAGIVLKAWISLGLWTLLPLAGALAWFKRQDLSKE